MHAYCIFMTFLKDFRLAIIHTFFFFGFFAITHSTQHPTEVEFHQFCRVPALIKGACLHMNSEFHSLCMQSIRRVIVSHCDTVLLFLG